MMYGFGDAKEPLPETVALVEVRGAAWLCRFASHCELQDMVCDYLSGMVAAAATRATGRSQRPGPADVLAVVRGDVARTTRAKELLSADEKIKKAKDVDLPKDDKGIEAL